MYDNQDRDDEKAMKSACHERKGLMAYFQSYVPSLHFPLMALIHYRGFILTAVSILPINGRNSLNYGSCDAGKNVMTSLPELNDAMAKAGKWINLEPHLVKNAEIYGPGDIEGHCGSDQKYYVLDFGRVMPPQAPLSPDAHREVFYNLFRPSFVKLYPRPLCSDAFTGWIAGDPRAKEMELAVVEATNQLYKQVIPQFANQVEEREILPSELITQLHKQGINIRHLGRVRANVRNKAMRKVLLTECAARAIKNELRKKLRDKMEELRRASEEPYRDVVFKYLRVVFYYEPRGATKISKATGEHSSSVNVSENGVFLSESSPLQNILLVGNDSCRSSLFYWEVKVLKGNKFKIGFSNKRNLEWQLMYGYDGEGFFVGSNRHHHLATKQGDVLGFLLNRDDGTICFTLNGKFTGVTIYSIPPEEELRPAVWISKSSTVQPVFNPQDFLFNPTALDKSDGLSLKSSKFWKKKVKLCIMSRFAMCLSEKELQPDFNLQKYVDINLLIERVTQSIGLKLSSSVSFVPDRRFELLPADIEDVGCRVSHMGIIELSEGIETLLKMKQSLIAETNSIPALKNALESIKSFVNTTGSEDPRSTFYICSIYFELAQRSKDEEALDYIKKAEEQCEETVRRYVLLNDPHFQKIYHLQGNLFTLKAILPNVNQKDRETFKVKASNRYGLAVLEDKEIVTSWYTEIIQEIQPNHSLRNLFLLEKAMAIRKAFPTVGSFEFSTALIALIQLNQPPEADNWIPRVSDSLSALVQAVATTLKEPNKVEAQISNLLSAPMGFTTLAVLLHVSIKSAPFKALIEKLLPKFQLNLSFPSAVIKIVLKDINQISRTLSKTLQSISVLQQYTLIKAATAPTKAEIQNNPNNLWKGHIVWTDNCLSNSLQITSSDSDTFVASYVEGGTETMLNGTLSKSLFTFEQSGQPYFRQHLKLSQRCLLGHWEDCNGQGWCYAQIDDSDEKTLQGVLHSTATNAHYPFVINILNQTIREDITFWEGEITYTGLHVTLACTGRFMGNDFKIREGEVLSGVDATSSNTQIAGVILNQKNGYGAWRTKEGSGLVYLVSGNTASISHPAHHHPLSVMPYFVNNATYGCDLCTFSTGSKWNCSACNFDLCHYCFMKWDHQIEPISGVYSGFVIDTSNGVTTQEDIQITFTQDELNGRCPQQGYSLYGKLSSKTNLEIEKYYDGDENPIPYCGSLVEGGVITGTVNPNNNLCTGFFYWKLQNPF
eukprot:TRINITY_DN1774_c1_g2_i15.p1 TRINITY_DN1774_c1_g2~~TRINITY_DN1774_c1_g2_i15.p1  ORF type:complete len:1230 (+),score=292.57 TRINITY_DN1774_c1_g2_i15:486-4175(+)